MSPAILAALLLCLSQCSGLSNHLKPYGENDLYGKYEEYLPECGPGEYLNLCGECVSGKTEKEDEYGKDSCGICGGLETCKVQCSDPMDILQEDGERNGCLKFISMAPSVFDIAESATGSVCIFGDGIKKETIVECSIGKGDESEIPIKTKTMEDKIELTFPLPNEEGSYDLHCNTSTAVDFMETLLIVDTNNLLPTAVDSSTITTWKENQLIVTVSKMSGPVEVLCFARTSSEDLVFSEWTSEVEGNSLSSTVKCPPFVPVNPQELEFGLAYSVIGTKTAKTVKVIAAAEAPRPVKAVFERESSKITVSFDQNLEEGKEDCSALFASETMLLIGEASFCEIAVNEVRVFLRTTALRPITTLNFKEGAVRTRFSEAVGGGRVEVISVEIVKAGELPDHNLECKKALKLQVVKPSIKANLNRTDIPIGQRQRLNLMAWRSARASTPAPKARSNSSGTETGVQNKNVDSASEAGAASMARQDLDQAWLQLKGPSSVNVQEYTVFQAALRSCASLPKPSKYKWSVTSDKDRMDTYFVNGPKLEVPPGTLLPNSKYKLSVQVLQNEEPIATETVGIETYIQNFNIHLQDAELVVGNGHAIDIDASRFLDVDSKAIKFSWTCKKGFCYLPGKEKRSLDSLDAFAHPHLRLPAKTLAVGRYIFTLEASSVGTKLDEAEVEVAVVSGQPPYISDLTVKEDETIFNVVAEVSEIRQKCQLFWSVLPRVGYSYINISQEPITVEGLPTQPQNIRMSLTLDKNLLISGSKSLLRVSADCARAGHIYRQFRFFVPNGLNGYKLEVEPKSGQALQTEFVYRIIEMKTLGKALYSFGYEENGTQIILYSGLNKEFKTYLGCCKFKTLVTVCLTKSNCITQYGPEIETILPPTSNSSISSLQMNLYKDSVMSSDYDEALANLKMILPVLEKVEPDAYKKLCQEAENIILERIAAHTERLNKDKDCLHEAVRMLDAASNLMATIPLSEESLNTILQFRDLVHANTRSLSEKIKENKISENLPPEPRVSSSNIVTVIPSNHKITENSKKKSFEAAEAALKSKIDLMKRFDNDLMINHKEKSMLLNSILYYSLRPDTEKYSSDPVLYNGAENLRRHKREVGDVKTNTINKEDMETVLKATILPLLQKERNWNKASEETLKLISILFDYSKYLCNAASAPHILGKKQDLVLLGTVPLKRYRKEKVKFPFCSGWCPPVKDIMNVTLVDMETLNNSSEDVCFSLASLRDDILINLTNVTVNSTAVRRSAIYWFHAMKYELGVVPGIPKNVTYDSKPSGHMVVQFPVWPDTKTSSNNTILECRMFSAEGWNNTACIKLKETPKENITSIQCNCSFPGFYSVFAVEDKKVEQELVTAKNEIPSTSSTKVVSVTTLKSDPTTLIVTTTLKPTVSTLQTTIAPKMTEKPDANKTSVTLKVPTSSTIPKDVTTTLLPVRSTTGVTTPSSVPTKATTSPTKSTTSLVTQAYDNELRTVPSIYQPYKYSATFRINENYTAEVGEMKEKFEENLEDQLQKILNMSEPVTVDAWKENDKIAIALRIPEKKLQEAGYSIALLKDLLKNGSLVLEGLHENKLNISAQDIVLTQQGGAAKSAMTAFVTIVFIFLAILIGSVVAAFYLRNSREQRSLRITQDLHSDPPAPKYLRLHDSVSLDSSGPSTPPNTEMESSLAVLTRPQRRGYETMETFSHFPGNI